jgi:trk system potassium uptake protein TrkA
MCVRVVIAGCGRVGSDLALSLADAGHDVSVLDIDSDAFRQLGSAFDGTTHRGSAYDIRVLREAGIEFADAFAAATRDDNVNLMAVQVATQVFGVPKTVARLDDPRRTDAYRALRVRHVAAGKLTSRAIQEQLLEDQSQYHLSFFGRGIEMVEMVMSADADGATVSDLEIEGRLRVAAIRRGLETYIGRSDFVLEEDDLVVAAAEDGIGRKVRRYCKGGEE